MKIILNKDVQNLGEEGDVREVAPGYARNYLIPKGLGVVYTKQNLALLEGKRKAIDKRKEEKRDHAVGLKSRIEALSLQIPMTVGESGRLFGSVTSAMLSEELAKEGIEIERKKIEIPEHTIKTTGNFVVKVKLYGNEVASLQVVVSGPEGTGPKQEVATAEKAAESIDAQDQVAAETQQPEMAEEQADAEAEAEVEEQAPAEAQPSPESEPQGSTETQEAPEEETDEESSDRE